MLPFNESRGISELSKLYDLGLPLDVVDKIKGILQNDFNKQTGKWKVNGCLCLLMPIGFAMVMAGIFTVRYTVGYGLIALGALTTLVFPVYVCKKNASRVKLIRKIISKVDEKTRGMVRMSEVYGTKRVKTKNGYRNRKYLKGFNFKMVQRMVQQNQLRNQKVTFYLGLKTDSTFQTKYNHVKLNDFDNF